MCRHVGILLFRGPWYVLIAVNVIVSVAVLPNVTRCQYHVEHPAMN